MAAAFRAAHTGSADQQANSSSDPHSTGANLPSIFDILSQESLSSSLKPGLKSLVQFLSQWHPRRLKIVHKFYDEFYAVFTLLLESHYLRQYSASFAENFYGMKRVLISDPKCDSSFSNFRGRLKSLICLVFFPYFASKLETLVNRLNETLPQRRTKLTNIFLRVYPLLLSAVKTICLVFQVVYAMRYVSTNFSLPSSSPFLYWAGVYLERLTAEDLQKFASIPLHLQQNGIVSKLWRMIFSLMSLVGRLFSYGLFLVQFLEYFYANDLTKQLSVLSETGEFHRPTAPPHPRKIIPTENYVFSSMGPGKCPLCYKTRENDTVLSVSGYVFCYACIFDFVRREERCPLTSLPASVDQLVKIYKPTIPV